MVKADLSRDYYADLELQPGASENDVKKQFKKLALKYHPDRNPGREAEVNSKFQIINSAQEVLTDPVERAKYDAGRGRGGGSRAYSGVNTSTSSGTRGNPWSNAGSQWAPPPKPPPPREPERRKPPPSSTGAQRYTQFTANGAAPKPAQYAPPPNAETMRENYQAWRSMKPQQNRTYPPPPPKPVPKEFTPQSGREESNNLKHAPPLRSSRPGFDDFRAASSDSTRASPSRNKSTNEPFRRNGFMPTTPGAGDEPAASSNSAYSNYRSTRPPTSRPSDRPDPPPRAAPPPDPLKHFRENIETPFEPRLSTPYATHGGEKTNPFENVDFSRSKSTRQPSARANAPDAGSTPTRDRYRSASPPRSKHNRNLSPEPGIARADSDIHLRSPKRTFSTAAGRAAGASEYFRANARKTPIIINLDTSSDADNSDSEVQPRSFGSRSRTYVKKRAAQSTVRSQEQYGSWGKPEGSTAATDQHPRKPSLAEFRQWWSSSEQHERNVLNDMKPDGPSNSTSNMGQNSGNAEKDEPSMYATFQKFCNSSRPLTRRAATLPTVLEEPAPQSSANVFPACSSNFAAFSEACPSCSKLLGGLLPGVRHRVHAGFTRAPCSQTPAHVLNPFETAQFVLVEKLVTNSASKKKPRSVNKLETILNSGIPSTSRDKDMQQFRGVPAGTQTANVLPVSTANKTLYSTEDSRGFSAAEMGSPFKRHRGDSVSHSIFHTNGRGTKREMDHDYPEKADKFCANSFSFDANNETFKPSHIPHTGFTGGSAENISTKFTPEDWDGKFKAGDCFTNEQGSKQSSRTSSGSRARQRSPIKGQQASNSHSDMRSPMSSVAPEILQQSKVSDPSISSPSGTKFAPEEWAKTFQPQNFAPPPFPSVASTTRPIRATRRSRTGSSNKVPIVSKTTGAATTTSGDDSSDPLEIGSRAAQPLNTPAAAQDVPAGTDSPNAMDIDPPLDPQPEPYKSRGESEFVGFKKYENGARNVPVEPSRSDWRAGDSSGTDATVPSLAKSQPELPPRRANANQSRRRTTKSADEDDFKTNLEELNNIEPLLHPATGLHSFADLTSHLPFTSKAAETLPISRTIGTGKLNIPNPPRAPMVPPSGLTRPTLASWDSYLTVFKTYMAEWDIFNQKMILHFVGRKNQVDSMKPGWLEAFGDTDLAKYKEGLKEDDQVRVTWSLACEKHMDAIEKFRSFKTLVRDSRM